MVLALLPVLAILTRRTLPLEVAAPLDWLAYCWLGVAFYTFLALLALEPVRLAAGSWTGPEEGAERRRSRRVGPGGSRAGATQRLSATGERHLDAVPSGRTAVWSPAG